MASPIPIPLKQRWQDARMRLVPALIFTLALIVMASLWKGYVVGPTLVGQAEAISANVSSYKPGMLVDLNVARFQRVKIGDSIGQILVTDPRILASSLAVIQAEINVLRIGMAPVAAQERTVMNYDHLRLDWMNDRSQLAMARVNLQLAETEAVRMAELFKDQIVSQRVFEQAQAARERLKSQVAELTHLVEEQGTNFNQLQFTNMVSLSNTVDTPLHAAIAVQESKLRLTEAELSPVLLKAPVDGMVSLVYHRPGEAITAGEPIVAISPFTSARIIGYLRAPIVNEPTVGMAVEVRTRNPHRETGSAKILEVGTQLEAIAPVLLPALKLANVELGLPISISLPPNIKIRPGELVDITLLPTGN